MLQHCDPLWTTNEIFAPLANVVEKLLRYFHLRSTSVDITIEIVDRTALTWDDNVGVIRKI